jgi:triacylglycerol lipase
MSIIVLAHGLFGFGDLLPRFSFVNYFNGVRLDLESKGHNLIVPTVDPVGSIQRRGEQLAQKILGDPKAGPGMHILAHSMGGLDARQALHTNGDLASRVATLVTIGTPHAGSTVADAFEKPTDPLRDQIPPFLMQQLNEHAGAVHNLTTDFCTQFNKDTPDVEDKPGVHIQYLEIAGDALQGGPELLLFDLASKIGKIKGPNDGVVTVESAQRPGRKLFAIWPLDHAGEIGWSEAILNVLHPIRAMEAFQEHLARYRALVAFITAEGVGAGQAAGGTGNH